MGKRRRASRLPPDMTWEPLFEKQEVLAASVSDPVEASYHFCDGDHVWASIWQESLWDGSLYEVEYCVLCGMIHEQ